MVLGIHRVSVYFYDAFYEIRLIQNADTFSGLPVLLKHFQQAADFEGDLFFYFGCCETLKKSLAQLCYICNMLERILLWYFFRQEI